MTVLSTHAPLTKRKKSSCGRTDRSIPVVSKPGTRGGAAFCADADTMAIAAIHTMVNARADFIRPQLGRVASMRRGSSRQTLPASRFDSQTEPRPTRTASPPLPKNCWTTVLVAMSMRDRGNSNEVTQTDPSPTAISPPPPGTPTSIVATTLLVFGSMRDTLPSPWFSVHTAPPPAAMKRGDLPTGIVSTTRLVRGSTRATVLCSVLVTQTASSPKARPYDPDAT